TFAGLWFEWPNIRQHWSETAVRVVNLNVRRARLQQVDERHQIFEGCHRLLSSETREVEAAGRNATAGIVPPREEADQGLGCKQFAPVQWLLTTTPPALFDFDAINQHAPGDY